MRYVYLELRKPAHVFRTSGFNIRIERITVHDACHIHGIVGALRGSASLQFGNFIFVAGTHHDAATRHRCSQNPSVDRGPSALAPALSDVLSDNTRLSETQFRFVPRRKNMTRIFPHGRKMESR